MSNRRESLRSATEAATRAASSRQDEVRPHRPGGGDAMLGPWPIAVMSVQSEDKDHLVCRQIMTPHDQAGDLTEGGIDVLVAKPFALQERRWGERRHIAPAYQRPDPPAGWMDLITAIRIGSGGAGAYDADSSGNRLEWMDLNVDGREALLMARITGSTSIGDNRWSYSWESVIGNEQATDPGTFKAAPSARTGTAYNGLEAGNTAAGVQGCGIDVDNLPTGWALQPIGDGAVVALRWVTDCSDPRSGWWQFEAANNADGECAT